MKSFYEENAGRRHVTVIPDGIVHVGSFNPVGTGPTSSAQIPWGGTLITVAEITSNVSVSNRAVELPAVAPTGAIVVVHSSYNSSPSILIIGGSVALHGSTDLPFGGATYMRVLEDVWARIS
jgi:hypothetical protein